MGYWIRFSLINSFKKNVLLSNKNRPFSFSFSFFLPDHMKPTVSKIILIYFFIELARAVIICNGMGWHASRAPLSPPHKSPTPPHAHTLFLSLPPFPDRSVVSQDRRRERAQRPPAATNRSPRYQWKLSPSAHLPFLWLDARFH